MGTASLILHYGVNATKKYINDKIGCQAGNQLFHIMCYGISFESQFYLAKLIIRDTMIGKNRDEIAGIFIDLLFPFGRRDLKAFLRRALLPTG